MEEAKRQMLARALLGKGMVGGAADAMSNNHRYIDYATRAQTSGKEPLPKNDPNWMQHMQMLEQGG